MPIIHGVSDDSPASTDVQNALPFRVNPASGALKVDTGSTAPEDLSVAVEFTATGGSTSSPNVAQQALAANASRNALIVQVDSTASAPLFVGFGSTSGQTVDNMIELQAGASLTFSGIVPSQAVIVLATVAGIEFVIMEA